MTSKQDAAVPRTATGLDPAPVNHSSDEAITMLGGAMQASVVFVKEIGAGLSILDRARVVTGELELLGYRIVPIVAEAAAPAADAALRAALQDLVAAVAQFLDEYDSEDGSPYEDELRDMTQNAIAALAQQRSEPAGHPNHATSTEQARCPICRERSEPAGLDVEPRHTEGQGEVCDTFCPHWQWRERLARLCEPTPDAAAIEAERQRQVADADAGRDPEGAGWTP